MALLRDKVAIITGSGGGLGRAYALRLASEGAAVVVNDIGKSAEGQSTAAMVVAEIRAAGGRAHADTSDVASMDGGLSLLKAAVDAFGRVDILVNNAGILRDKSLLKLEEPDWDAVIKVNLKSLFCVTKPVFGWMKEHGGGVIVNTSSTSGLIGNFGQTNYAAAKGGVWAFSNALTLEGRKSGIRVWTLAPAAVTPLMTLVTDQQIRDELRPEHVAEVLLYMVSPLSGDITGRTLYASGQRIMELRLTAAAGMVGGGRRSSLSAQDIADAADRLYVDLPPLTLSDLSLSQ